MIVLEHTNPPTIYLDYHYWLPERGASGVMIGAQWTDYNISGPFITCNPSPGGELGLGSHHYALSLVLWTNDFIRRRIPLN